MRSVLLFPIILFLLQNTIFVQGVASPLLASLSDEVVDSVTPPTIDIDPLIRPEAYSHEEITKTRDLIRSASEKWGFYSIINHSIPSELIDRLQDQMKRFFALPKEVKSTIRRNRYNSRGFADNEYTKQIIDLKEVFDLGQLEPYNSSTPGLSAIGLENQQLDGVNYWLPEETLPDFREVIEEYYKQCLRLSNVLVNAIVDSLEFCFLQEEETKEAADPTNTPSPSNPHSLSSHSSTSVNETSRFTTSQEFFDHHFGLHSSLMRLNYYPITSNNPQQATVSHDGVGSTITTERLGISRHTDAGAITILLQDLDVASLEVYSGTKQDDGNGRWVPVTPVANALTINSADMLQVWTNNRFKAPEHRVRATRPDSPHPRYTVAFFLNPNYDSMVSPYPCKVDNESRAQPPLYRPIRWGDFRSLRYLGDYEDIGEEIQIEKYRIK